MKIRMSLFMTLLIALFAVSFSCVAQQTNAVEVNVGIPTPGAAPNVEIKTNGVPARAEPSEVDLTTSVMAMGKQVLNSPGSCLVIIVLSLIAYLIERTPKITSDVIPWWCILGGGFLYFAFSKKSSVPADFPYPVAVLFANGMICGAAALVAHGQLVARFLLPKKLPVWIIATLIGLSLGLNGCTTPKAETGGVYKPTNEVGQVVYDDTQLAVLDQSYKLLYESADGIFTFEKSQRANFAKIDPKVAETFKEAVDKARDTAWDINVRWGRARQAYAATHIPVGLTTLQDILAELQRLIPAIQTQVVGANAVLIQNKTSTK